MIPHSRPQVTETEIAAVVAALEQGHLAQGEEVAALEVALSRMFNGANAVVVSSGTAALYLSLAALNVSEGDFVSIPSYTCNSLFSAVSFCGAEPILADVGEQSITVDATTVAQNLAGRTLAAAIVPHTCGFLADIESISELGVPVIEDCAQAIGSSSVGGQQLGTSGDIAIMSFYATKLLPAGEGGACVTSDEDLANRIRSLRDCDERIPNTRSFNFKMPDMNASLAISKLDSLDKSLETRLRIADRYDGVMGDASVRLKVEQPVCFRYIANTGGKIEETLASMTASGIECRRPIWRPLHHTLGGDCPNTDWAHRNLVSVPVYPGLSNAEIEHIGEMLASIHTR